MSALLSEYSMKVMTKSAILLIFPNRSFIYGIIARGVKRMRCSARCFLLCLQEKKQVDGRVREN